MKEIEISNRKIGPDHKPLLIAEIGINHNGSLDEAKKIVDAAVFAGIEVIKHQTHVVEDEMSPEAVFSLVRRFQELLQIGSKEWA